MSDETPLSGAEGTSDVRNTPGSRLLYCLAIALFPALLVRAWLSITAGGSFHPTAYLRGTAFDLLVALLVTLFVTRFPFALYAILLAFFHVALSSLYYGNYEHILANGDAIIPRDLYFMLSPEFREGSGTTISNPFLFALMLLVPLGIFVVTRGRGRTIFDRPPVFIALLVLVAAMAWSIPDNLNRRVWQQSNVAVLVVHDALGSLLQGTPVQVTKPKDFLIQQYSKGDLLGRAIVRGDRDDRTNVLLILLEGISGTDVYPDYSKFLPGRKGLMPQFRQIAERGLSYPHTISLQRKTNRGMWSILCGQLPNLKSVFPKIDYASRLRKLLNFKCLAHHLVDAGYRTVYLQAADLKIMQKDIRIPELGFEEVHGVEWFEPPFFNTGWGPADHHFFEQATRMVSQLESKGKPWFLTMLTSGTHHPYKVPDEFKHKNFNHRQRAVRLADHAIGAFIKELGRRGLLETTLVIITSDESYGAGRNTPRIYENWVPLVVLDPSKRIREIHASFSLNDLQLSVLDYLDLASVDRPPAGRSIFREYESARPLVFANAYARRIYQFTENNQLLQCVSDFSQCQVRSYDDSTFLWDEPDGGTEVSPESAFELKSLVSWNDWEHHRLRILKEGRLRLKNKKLSTQRR